MKNNTVLITEEHWTNSQLSIARYYGGIKINGEEYNIVNKEGTTVFELSDPKSPHFVGFNNPQAIPPGEPCDLVKKGWIPFYKKLGRNKLMNLLNEGKTFEEVEQYIIETSL